MMAFALCDRQQPPWLETAITTTFGSSQQAVCLRESCHDNVWNAALSDSEDQAARRTAAVYSVQCGTACILCRMLRLPDGCHQTGVSDSVAVSASSI